MAGDKIHLLMGIFKDSLGFVSPMPWSVWVGTQGLLASALTTKPLINKDSWGLPEEIPVGPGPEYLPS